MHTLIKNVDILTMNPSLEEWFDGWIAFADGRITYVGPGQNPEVERQYDEVIDGHGYWLMPGLVNTHGHAAMILLRGLGDDLPLQEWLEAKMWPLEARFTADHVYWGTSLAAVEMIKSGTTLFLDMYAHMDQVGKVVEQAGLRATLSRGMIGLCSEQEQQTKLDDTAAFIRQWQGEAQGRIATMIAPHSAYTCPPSFIMKALELADELEIPVHTHLSETAREVAENEVRYGCRPVEHLEKLGFFQRSALVAHAVHVNDEEIHLLKEHDVRVSHNPMSNLKLASGVAPIPRMLEHGLTVGLGTDGAASNNHLDMFEEMRIASLVQKGVTGNPLALPATTMLRMATLDGAKALFRDHETGSLEVGKAADFIMLDPKQNRLLPAHQHSSMLVYSASGAEVSHMYVDGRCLMWNGELLTLDEEQIRREVARVIHELLPS